MKAATVFFTGDPYDTLKPMAEKYGAVYCQKARSDAEMLAELYQKLLTERVH